MVELGIVAADPPLRHRLLLVVDRSVERLRPWVLAWSGVVVSLCVAGRILVAPQWDWNAARLSFSFALAGGFDLYPLDASQPAPGYIYGPVFALAYLPAVIFDSPTPAVLAGVSLAVACVIGPSFALLRSWMPVRGYDWIGLVALTGACLVSGPLRYSTFSIHADAPMLGLLTAAMGLWCRASRRGGTYLAAAFLVAAALWCKQNVAPVVLVFPLWSLLTAGRRSSVRGLVSLGFAGAVLSLVAIFGFGYRDLLLHMVTLPGATPWYGSGTTLERLAPAAGEYVGLAAPWLAGLAVLTTLHWRAFGATRGGWRSWLGGCPWLLPAFASVILAPTCILAKVRMGGGVNSWTPTLLFLVLACLGAALDLARAPGRSGGIAGVARLSRVLLLGWAAGLAAHETFGSDLRELRRTEVRHPFTNPQQQAHDYLLANPGSAYFPWNPLAHLMAESRLVHHADGVIIRILAGSPLSQAEFEAGVGRTFALVASAPGRKNETVQARYLPQFSQRVELSGLPGWTVYKVPSPPQR